MVHTVLMSIAIMIPTPRPSPSHSPIHLHPNLVHSESHHLSLSTPLASPLTHPWSPASAMPRPCLTHAAAMLQHCLSHASALPQPCLCLASASASASQPQRDPKCPKCSQKALLERKLVNIWVPFIYSDKHCRLLMVLGSRSRRSAPKRVLSSKTRFGPELSSIFISNFPSR